MELFLNKLFNEVKKNLSHSQKVRTYLNMKIYQKYKDFKELFNRFTNYNKE